MDILVSSNLERQLFELTGRDALAIRGWMDDLKTKGRFQVDKQTFAQLRKNYSADWVSNEESLTTIREVYKTHNYLIDPHTAVAWRVAERLRSTNPVLVVSTAHWAKFGTDVYRALNGLAPSEPLDDAFSQESVTSLIEHIAETYNAGAIPKPLAELSDLEVRFKESCGKEVEDIEDAVRAWLQR
jgi:threonine synthase